MNSIIAFALKWSGGGWIWGKLDGLKTILGFVGKMVAGVGSMCVGAGAIILTVNECKDMACVVAIGRGFSTNPDGIMILAGFYAFCSGLQGLGAWHKEQKAKAEAIPAPNSSA
ncbi:MAG: hypothetical protein WC822_02360 [Candidatus Paceibacterota bacterium]|jgi:hypothetical protein